MVRIPTDDRGTVVHDAQTQSAVVFIRLVWDADAVILNAKHRRVPCQIHGNAIILAPGVLDSIVDRFLGDEIELGRDEVVLDENRLRAIKKRMSHMF